MNNAPFVDLSRKKIDHGGHNLLGAQAKASSPMQALPLLALRLNLLSVGFCTQLASGKVHIDGR
jgi:hypothetical protein